VESVYGQDTEALYTQRRSST